MCIIKFWNQTADYDYGRMTNTHTEKFQHKYETLNLLECKIEWKRNIKNLPT